MLQVKQRALAEGQTLTAYIEDALREKVARQEEHAKREPIRLIVHHGGPFQPGVDIDNSAALLDLMDAYDAAARR